MPWEELAGAKPVQPRVEIIGHHDRSERWDGWHILTVAESGFSMLDIYGRKQRGLNIDVIRSFAQKISESDQSASLFPHAPISAVPRRFFRDQADSSDPAVLTQFKRHIVDFLVSNRRTIHASRILVNFHVSSDLVPLRYIRATEDVFRYVGPYSLVSEVVIFL